MLKNYLTIAYRNLLRHKGYTIINVAGLAVGVACCILILLFVRDELSFDRFHQNADRIFRMTYGNQLLTHAALAPTLLEHVPEVELAVRFSRRWSDVLVRKEADAFYESRFFFVDASVFRLFDFELLRGDPETALARPFTVVLTESMAEKYFSDEDPVGQTISIQGLRRRAHEFEITGVARDVPHNSHLRFEFLASYATRAETEASPANPWRSIGDYTYVLLREQAEADAVVQNVRQIIAPLAGEIRAEGYWMQPLTDVHLRSQLVGEIEPNSDVRYVYIFSVLAFLVVVVACINYVNLATARSAYRMREVGVRKIVGARRTQLGGQFLGESFLMSLIAVVLAVFLVEATIPLFREVVGRPLAFDVADPATIVWIAAIVLGLGLVAGIYPAVFLSGASPIGVLKGLTGLPGRGAFLRNGLVVVQFCVSVMLIVGTLTISGQLEFVRNARLGIDEEQVIVVAARDGLSGSYDVFNDELLAHSGIVSVSASGLPLPHTSFTGIAMRPEGIDSSMGVNFDAVDSDFAATLGIPIVEGRDLSPEFDPSSAIEALVNESAVRAWEWEDPIGKTFGGFQPPLRVVGVMQDFHYRSLRDHIEPLVLAHIPQSTTVFVRFRTDDVPGIIDYLRRQWAAFGPGTPLEYSFLDDRYARIYTAEERMASIFSYFSLVAIVIACVGLFGLATYAAERRTKEIGIRKVLGASVPAIVALLSRDFVRLVLVGTVIAVPIGYLAMSRWLEDFAYRLELGPDVFLLAGCLALATAMLTVSYHAVRAALANPAESLRHE